MVTYIFATQVGESVTLTCQSNIPWYLCGWQQPNGQWCDRLSSSYYDTHCHNNPNIQYFVSYKNKESKYQSEYVELKIKSKKLL